MGSNNSQKPGTDASPKLGLTLGNQKKKAGISYVAISRVKSLSTCVIEPTTFERLTSFKSLAKLAVQTKRTKTR